VQGRTARGGYPRGLQGRSAPAPYPVPLLPYTGLSSTYPTPTYPTQDLPYTHLPYTKPTLHHDYPVPILCSPPGTAPRAKGTGPTLYLPYTSPTLDRQGARARARPRHGQGTRPTLYLPYTRLPWAPGRGQGTGPTLYLPYTRLPWTARAPAPGHGQGTAKARGLPYTYPRAFGHPECYRVAYSSPGDLTSTGLCLGYARLAPRLAPPAPEFIGKLQGLARHRQRARGWPGPGAYLRGGLPRTVPGR
jgi:hypothetical protein